MQTKDVPGRYMVSMQPEGSLPPVYLIHHLLGDVLITARSLVNLRLTARCSASNHPSI